MMNSPIPNYDTLFCGKQPLHQTGAIQPHGVLLVVDKSNFNVIQVSENIERLLPIAGANILGEPLSSIIRDDCFTEIRTKAGKGFFSNKQVIKITFINGDGEVRYVASIHEKDGTLIIEVEFANILDALDNGGDLFQQVNDVMSAIEAATTVDDICNITAREIKKWSGFDKVMIYWFDDEWNGTVIAEEMEPGMDDYMGLKFPASDIPKPARDLYLKNPVRLIPDSGYLPVNIFPAVNPGTGLLTDLSNCKLRSVASVHLEYLKNMGVVASMSTRIIHNNKLGGLIACHHRTPKFLTYREFSAFEIISAVVSGKISMALNLEIENRKAERLQYSSVLLEKVHLHNSMTKGLMESEELLLHLLNADGVVITGKRKLEKAGLTPDDNQIMDLTQWLQQQQFENILHLPSLSAAYAAAADYCQVASGILAISIQPEKGNFLIAFRPEIITTVKWGGNPNDALTFEPGSTVYHPRNSFKIWTQTSKFSSEPWRPEEIEVAEGFRNALVAFKLQQKNRDISTVLDEFKMVTNIIPQLLFSTSAMGQMDYCNHQWDNYTGLKAREIRKLGWTWFLHPVEAERIVHDFNTCLKAQTTFTTDCRLKKSDGQYRWFVVKALPLKDSTGNVIKWYGSCTDIDGQKRMEEVLEQQVESRTLELKKAYVELKETNAELEQFVKVASHDIQEQVRKIQLFGNLVKEFYLPSEKSEVLPYFNKIINAAYRLKRLIGDLLIYSGLTNRRHFKSVNLQEVFIQVQEELSPVIIESKAIIVLQPLPVIDAIEEEMSLVFKNLIANSIQFANDTKYPEIQIEAQRVAGLDFAAPIEIEGEFVRIIITDNGIGFDDQYAELIFQVFQRLPLKKKTEGTGIGLAIVRKITDKHKGIIKASGKPNEGAVFTLVLPLKQRVPEYKSF